MCDSACVDVTGQLVSSGPLQRVLGIDPRWSGLVTPIHLAGPYFHSWYIAYLFGRLIFLLFMCLSVSGNFLFSAVYFTK